MPTRDFYTLPEAAQILEAPQRSLLKSLETGEIEGELDPQSGRWIPCQPCSSGGKEDRCHRFATNRCAYRSNCSFFVEDLTPRETTGYIVGLSLGTHGGRVGRQVTGGRNKHMGTYCGVAQSGILPEGGFYGLYGMEVAVLPEEQAAHHGQEPVNVSSSVEVGGDEFPRCVYSLPFIE